MLLNIFNILYLKTHFFSVHVRIIVTFLILFDLVFKSKLSFGILELFYLSLVYTLTGQLYIDYKKFINKKKFNKEDIYGYIFKLIFTIYYIFILKVKLKYSGIIISTLLMLLYKLNYNVYNVYEVTFIESVFIYIGTLFLLGVLNYLIIT